MPRHDGNTISRPRRHHRAMKSAAHGKGNSSKRRQWKKLVEAMKRPVKRKPDAPMQNVVR
jgi:hypothetical protein